MADVEEEKARGEARDIMMTEIGTEIVNTTAPESEVGALTTTD